MLSMGMLQGVALRFKIFTDVTCDTKFEQSFKIFTDVTCGKYIWSSYGRFLLLM